MAEEKDVKNPGSGTPAVGDPKPADEGGSPADPGAGTPDSDIEVKDGFVRVPEKTYNSLKDDMHKYKKERNEARGTNETLEKKVSDIEAEQKKKKEEKLLEDGKFKELAEKKEQENVDLQTKLNQAKIDNALKVKALEMGINDIDGLKLADLSGISIDPDNGKLLGIDEAVESLKKEKSYLFEKPSGPQVDKGKPGLIPKDKLSKKDVLYNAELAQKLKKEDPERYKAIMENGSG